MPKLPDSIRKRDVLYSDRAVPEELSAFGRQYMEEDRIWEAVEFFARANDAEGIQEVKKAAISLGDSYLLRRLEILETGDVDKSDWSALAEHAEKAGKFRDAIEGFDRGGNEAKADELRAALAPEEEAPAEQPLLEGETSE